MGLLRREASIELWKLWTNCSKIIILDDSREMSPAPVSREKYVGNQQKLRDLQRLNKCRNTENPGRVSGITLDNHGHYPS